MITADLYEDVWMEEDGIHFKESVIKRDLLQQAIKTAPDGIDEYAFANALLEVIQVELVAACTGNVHRVTENGDMQLMLRAMMGTCSRIRVPFPTLPFRDFRSLDLYLRKEGFAADESAKIETIESFFDPISERIFSRAVETDFVDLVQPITPHTGTGWEAIDIEIEELRESFKHARTPQAHNAIGNTCVRIIEMVADVAFDVERHGKDKSKSYARSNTKNRLDAIVDVELEGSSNAALRSYFKSLATLTQDTKHNTTPNRQAAGIAADGVIALANMLRRIVPSDY